jgi:branched-chain amino acid transport system substrate-binding protein
MRHVFHFGALFLLVLLLFEPIPTVRADQSPVVVGLDADMSAGSAQAGEAIRRGALLAVEEINAAGGLLGRPLALEVRDHRGNPLRGVINMEQFAANPDLLAVLGGLHTPVALEELAVVHRERIIFLIPWAAGTGVVENGYDPNFVFRVSVRDEYAGAFLVNAALGAGYRRPGLLLEQTGWGRSNEKAMLQALAEHDLLVARVEWFHWGVRDMGPQVDRLLEAGADVILLVANAPEGAVAVDTLHRLPEDQRPPIVSHWGITGGSFFDLLETQGCLEGLYVLQTFSFLEPQLPERAAALFQRYHGTFPDVGTPRLAPAPPGTAHAYDLVHLLARAVKQAGTLDRERVREALERLEFHRGVMRDYAPPFTPDRHDALTADDFRIACFAPDRAIVPCAITPRRD